MKPPELVPDWDEPAWRPMRDAWDQRGLEYPPTAGQRSKMWPIVREFGQKIHDWVAEAPHETSSTFEIVAYIVTRAGWERTRQTLFQALTDEEQREWFDLEDNAPQIFTTGRLMQRARVEGVGLPNVADSENPYRVMLREAVDQVKGLVAAEEAQRAAAAERQQAKAAADAKRPHLMRLLEISRDKGLRLVDDKADITTILDWGERTGELVAAALGPAEARPFLDKDSYRGILHLSGFSDYDWTIRQHCGKLTALISGIDRADIRADFEPDALPIQPS